MEMKVKRKINFFLFDLLFLRQKVDTIELGKRITTLPLYRKVPANKERLGGYMELRTNTSNYFNHKRVHYFHAVMTTIRVIYYIVFIAFKAE